MMAHTGDQIPAAEHTAGQCPCNQLRQLALAFLCRILGTSGRNLIVFILNSTWEQEQMPAVRRWFSQLQCCWLFPDASFQPARRSMYQIPMAGIQLSDNHQQQAGVR